MKDAKGLEEAKKQGCAGSTVQVVKHLPNMLKALGSTPSTARRRRRRKRDEGGKNVFRALLVVRTGLVCWGRSV